MPFDPKNKIPDDPDFGNFEATFAGLEDPNFCDPGLIDPSKPGWEIILHFDDHRPEIQGSQAHEDMKLIKSLPIFCYANISYTRATRTVVISPLQDCSEEQFEDDILDILKRYRLMAKAPESSRRVNGAVKPPEQFTPAEISPFQVIETVITNFKPLIVEHGMVGFDSEESQKIYKFDFDEIVCTIPVSDPKSGQNLDRIKKLAEEEELELIIDEQDGEYAIIISKDPHVAYIKSMNPENVIFLEQLGSRIM